LKSHQTEVHRLKPKANLTSHRQLIIKWMISVKGMNKSIRYQKVSQVTWIALLVKLQNLITKSNMYQWFTTLLKSLINSNLRCNNLLTLIILNTKTRSLLHNSRSLLQNKSLLNFIHRRKLILKEDQITLIEYRVMTHSQQWNQTFKELQDLSPDLDQEWVLLVEQINMQMADKVDLDQEED